VVERADGKGPLFRTIRRTTSQLTRAPLPQANAYAMISGARADDMVRRPKLAQHSCLLFMRPAMGGILFLDVNRIPTNLYCTVIFISHVTQEILITFLIR
jgi:hypothetical protein